MQNLETTVRASAESPETGTSAVTGFGLLQRMLDHGSGVVKTMARHRRRRGRELRKENVTGFLHSYNQAPDDLLGAMLEREFDRDPQRDESLIREALLYLEQDYLAATDAAKRFVQLARIYPTESDAFRELSEKALAMAVRAAEDLRRARKIGKGRIRGMARTPFDGLLEEQRGLRRLVCGNIEYCLVRFDLLERVRARLAQCLAEEAYECAPEIQALVDQMERARTRHEVIEAEERASRFLWGEGARSRG